MYVIDIKLALNMQYPHFMLSLIGVIIVLDYIVTHSQFSVFTGTTEVIISQHAAL